MLVTRLKRANFLKVVLLAVAAMLVGFSLALLPTEKAAKAAFPGQNGKIAFDSAQDNGGVFTMDDDGSAVRHLIDDGGHPAWSPDGTKIAFQAFRDGDVGIYTANADGSGITYLASGYDPAWSPNGTKLAFVRSFDLNDPEWFEPDEDIYTMNADGSNVQPLRAAGYFREREPAWSPDGTKIAFSGGYYHDDTGFGIYTVNLNPDGSQTFSTILPPYAGALSYFFAPNWSPDGTKIAVEAEGDLQPAGIATVNADGSNLTPLTSSVSRASDRTPAWSPDGTKIAFVSTRDGDADIYTMKADGSNVTNITNNALGDAFPDWQPLPIAYTFSGFFSPVDNPPTLNVVKVGKTVPVKFSLGGDEGQDVFAQGYPKSRQIDCSSSALLDDIERTLSAGHSGLSYDPTTERYTYTWKTKEAWEGTCRRLVMRLDDGSVHRASFKFR
jgi:dipeptidyl aminopeptidase/acylaminoacyl peptidase